MRYLIRGAELIDGGMTAPQQADLIIADGAIEAIGSRLSAADGTVVIDGTGHWVTPALQDSYAELLLSGAEPRETVLSAARAARAGGYSRWHLLPNCEPVLDSAAALMLARRDVAAAGTAAGLIAALTVGNAGKQLAPLAELIDAGAVAFSDGGRPIADGGLLRKAMAYAAAFNVPLLLQPDDTQLSSGGIAHEGAVSTRLGLPGIPAAAESSAAARIIALAELTGARVHLTRLSSAAAVEQLRAARRRGLPISASVTAHHLLLDEHWLLGSLHAGAAFGELQPQLLPPYHSSTRLLPPLRSAADRTALAAALADGTIDVLAADHSPRAQVDVDCEYGLVRPGISSLETAVAAGLTLVAHGTLPAVRLIGALTDGPARLYGQSLPRLTVGARVGLTLIDPQRQWKVDAARLQSRGRNTPFHGQLLRGAVSALWQDGLLIDCASGAPTA